jgi:phosphoglycolate phosphatase-like HAD superfamily hydrolase
VPPIDPTPELVIFDIDGTLLATDRFWLDIGHAAVRKAYERHGITDPLPDDSRFLDAIGMPMSTFWQHILPSALFHLRDEIESEAQELEQIAFARGLGAMYPGARKLLDELHRAGRTLGLASNCGQRYLDGFVAAFGIDSIIAEERCLDSPGIRNKTDMIADILTCTGISNAIMVGDRESDREAAHGNRIPFVLFTGGFGGTASTDGDRVARDYGELAGMLLRNDGRTRPAPTRGSAPPGRRNGV